MLAFISLTLLAGSAGFLTTIVEVPVGVLVGLFVLILLPTEDLIELIQYVVVWLINHPPRRRR